MQSTPLFLFPRVTAFFELVSLGFATIGVRATLAAVGGELPGTLLSRNRQPIQAQEPA
jgi:hypothetical protein